MTEKNRLMQALRNADADGDTEAATRIANMIKTSQQTERRPEQPLGTTPQPELWGGGSQFSSGVLQGLGDELKAGVAAAKESFSGGLPFGEAYDQALPQYQRSRELYKKENPILAPTLDIAGQTAPWLAGARFMPTTLPGAPMLQKMQQNAHLGAKLGALSGFTNAEGNLVDRVEGAGIGLGGGAVIGAATPPVVEGIIATIKFGINQLVSRLPYQQQSLAARKIAEAMERDGVSPEQAAAKMEEMGSEAALLDLGPNTRALAGSAQQTPGEGKTKITDFLINRQEGVRDADKVIQGGQINRVTDQIDDLVPETYSETQSAIEGARKGFGQGYNQAREGADLVDVMPLIKSLDDEIANSKGGIKQSLQKVKDLLVDPNGNPEITIETLHQSKMAIDELMSGEARTSMGSVSKGRVKDYTNRLLDTIKNSGESGAIYDASRVGTRGEWMKQEALESGAKFMNRAEFLNPEALASSLAKMSPEELHTFRVGAAQALKQKLEVNTRTDVTKKIMDIPVLEDKIRFAFGDVEMFKKYITGLESEKTMFKGYSMMGGSQTAEREAAKADAVIDPSRVIRGLIRMKSPNPLDTVGGMVDILGGSKDRLLMSEKLSKGLGEGLTGQNVASIQKAYRAGKITNRVKNDMIKALTITGATGGQETMQKALGAR